MKNTVLFILAIFYTALGWAQIEELLDSNGNPIVLSNGANPGFVELNNKFYFIGLNSSNTDVIYALDTNNQVSTEFDTFTLIGSNTIEALTVLNGQLYFVASDVGVPSSKRLYRLFGNNSAQLTSNEVIVTGLDEMVAWDGELYFSGKLTSTSDNALLKYDGNGNFNVVNTSVPGVDFNPLRLMVRSATNTLFFYTRVGDFGVTEGLWRLHMANKSSGVTTISQVGNVDWIDFFNFAPPITEFANRIYIIGRTENDSERFLYQVNGALLSRVNNNAGYATNSFYDIQTNNGGTTYNGKLALFRSSAPNSFVYDKLDLLSTDNAIQEFDLPNNVSGAQFYGELNGALIFYGVDQTSSFLELLYEFRENTFESVLPQMRVIHDYLNNQPQRTYFGNTFNDQFFFYGASVNDLDERVVHLYDPQTLNYNPIIGNQEQLAFFGSLGFVKVLQQLSLQDDTPFEGGTKINDLSPLNDLEEADYLSMSFIDAVDLTGLGNLERVYRFFDIFNNPELETLEGLNTNIVFDLQSPTIVNNSKLVNFCALQPWAVSNASFSSSFSPSGNGYDPSFTELQDANTCRLVSCTPLIFTDTNFESFLLNPDLPQRILDGNGNPVDLNQGGAVCAELVATVTSLDLTATTNISSLTDLTYFSALKFLNIGGDLVTIASIDLSQNFDLEVLIASGFKGNGFDLQLRNNSKLRELYTYNSGSNLDINPQDNPEIEILRIGGFSVNPFSQTVLNLSDYQRLEEFWAQELNGITSFGLSTAANLKKVYIEQCGIEELDLSGSPLLDDITVVFNSELQQINLKNGTNNPALENLAIDFNGTDLCVQIDDEGYAEEQVNLGNWSISNASFSENCGLANAIVMFENSASSGFEVANENLPRLIVEGTVSNTSTVRIEDLTNGTATASTTTSFGDYIMNGGNVTYTITIPAGTYTAANPIPLTDFEILDDFQYEGNEILNLQLTGVSGDLDIGATADFQYTILEDDYTVDILGLQDAVEGGTNGQFELALFDDNGQSVANATGIELTIDFLDEGDAIRGTDYTLSGGIILNGASSGIITVIAVNDNDSNEGNEEVRITLVQGQYYKINAPTQSSIAIIDNTASNGPFDVEVYPVVDDEQQDGTGEYTYYMNEGPDKRIGIDFNLLGLSAAELSQYEVEIVTRDGSALAGSGFDYIGRNGTVALTTVDGGGNFDEERQFISLVDDTNPEGEERFFIDITPLTANLRLIDPSDGLGTPLNVGETLTFEIRIRDADVVNDDTDGDGVLNVNDNCPGISNADQSDIDNDGVGDVCDDDRDGDGVPNNQDNCPDLAGVASNNGCPPSDSDGDGIADDFDNCPDMANTDQADLDDDGVGDVCDSDRDGDGVPNNEDDCPDLAGVATNNGCPPSDSDGDGIVDNLDNCPNVSNADQADLDNDGIGDLCDDDRDGDGISNSEDNCMDVANSNQADTDGDGIGDACDTDQGNLILAPEDLELRVKGESCPNVPNGSITVSANVDGGFTVTVSAAQLTSPVSGPLSQSSEFVLTNLAADTYEVCITTEEFPAFEQCYRLAVTTSENIIVDSQGVDSAAQLVNYTVQGSTLYVATVNGKSYTYEFESTKITRIKVPLEIGENKLQITGISDCQGVFKDEIVLGKITAYPNPVGNMLNVIGITEGAKALVTIVDMRGTVVLKAAYSINKGTIQVATSQLSKGMYVISLRAGTSTAEFKMLKQ